MMPKFTEAADKISAVKKVFVTSGSEAYHSVGPEPSPTRPIPAGGMIYGLNLNKRLFLCLVCAHLPSGFGIRDSRKKIVARCSAFKGRKS